MARQLLAVGCVAKPRSEQWDGLRAARGPSPLGIVGWEAMMGWGGTWGEGVSLSSVALSPAGEEKRIREFYQSRGLDRVTQPSNEGGHARGPRGGA